MEEADLDAYRDPALKDVVGQMPRLLCALHDPAELLLASASVKCLRRMAPCWKSAPDIVEETQSSAQSDAPPPPAS